MELGLAGLKLLAVSEKFIPYSPTGMSLVKGSAHCKVPQLNIQGIGISYQPSDTIISPAVTHMLIKRIFL